MPERIQLRRTKGWRKPPDAVVVSRPSRFGNPFTIADAIEAGYEQPRRACVEHYQAWLGDHDHDRWHVYYQDVYLLGATRFDRQLILTDLPQLAGRDLACWCPLPELGEPDWCHAAVLLDLANPVAEVALR